MNKEEWLQLVARINFILEGYKQNYYDSKHGKNVDIRNAAQRRVDVAIAEFKNLIQLDYKQHIEVYRLLVQRDELGFDSSQIFKEITMPSDLESELNAFIDRIKKHIGTLPN